MAVASQTPLSMRFSRPEYYNGVPFPSPGNLPNPGVKLYSPALQPDYLLSEPTGKLFDCIQRLNNIYICCTLKNLWENVNISE